MFEKIFDDDCISKRERVERTINLECVDRVAIHEQLSYNPRVIEYYTGKKIDGYNFTKEDIGITVRKTLDASFPVFTPYGLGHELKPDGFEYHLDNWTKWISKRPFSDPEGAKEWLELQIKELEDVLIHFDAKHERKEYHDYILDQIQYIGETVIIDWSIMTRFSEIFDKMGLDIFCLFYYDYPETMLDFMKLSTEYAVKKVLAAGDNSLTPVALIAEDFCSKTGPIFPPEMLNIVYYPFIRQLTDAWHETGLKVIFHTDGYYKTVVPNLINCHVDGFYCLERNCGMNIEELKAEWPSMIWAGGVNGVDTMEFGTPEAVRKEVHDIIKKTDALNKGGIFIDTSSEINPPIPLDNFRAMIEAVHDIRNEGFKNP
jgi:uroporphyrinogen-III decarboxylase